MLRGALPCAVFPQPVAPRSDQNISEAPPAPQDIRFSGKLQRQARSKLPNNPNQILRKALASSFRADQSVFLTTELATCVRGFFGASSDRSLPIPTPRTATRLSKHNFGRQKRYATRSLRPSNSESANTDQTIPHLPNNAIVRIAICVSGLHP